MLTQSPPPRPAAQLPRPAGIRGLRFLARNRFQVLGGFLLAVVLPALFRSNFEVPLSVGSLENTVLATTVALLAGAFLLRRMTAFPGVQAIAFVLPSFTAIYGVTILAFFFLRIDYSRFEFLASFLLAIGWYHLVLAVERRVNRPSLLLLPFGHAGELLASDKADWLVVDTPDRMPDAVTGVVADLRAEMGAEWERFLARCALQGLPVYHSKQVSESLTGRVEIEHLSENTLGSLLPSSVYLRFKRLCDLVLALILIPLALPLAAGAAILIRREDGGPALFRQKRVGFHGDEFTIVKFRTMKIGAPAEASFTSDNDSRITRIGKVLRRYRIDELPQIINILRGEMSWIGPRPEARDLSGWYESQIHFYSYRHIVRPGISGWAQVNQGNVAQIEAATYKLHYDFYYIKYFSFWLDLLIALRTVRTVVTGFGAR